MKFFEKLTKSSRIIFIIGAFIYAALYATFHAGGMGNTFMSVLVGLIYLIVGTGLLVAAPLLLLFKRDEAAKYVYLVLLGYWLLSTVQTYLNQADIASNSNDALTVVIGIFSFILGLWLPLSRSQNQWCNSSHHVFIPGMQKEEEKKAKGYSG